MALKLIFLGRVMRSFFSSFLYAGLKRFLLLVLFIDFFFSPLTHLLALRSHTLERVVIAPMIINLALAVECSPGQTKNPDGSCETKCPPGQSLVGTKCQASQASVVAREESKVHMDTCKSVPDGEEKRKCYDKLPLVSQLCADRKGSKADVDSCYKENMGKDINVLRAELNDKNEDLEFDEEVDKWWTVLGNTIAGINITMVVVSLFGMRQDAKFKGSCWSKTVFSVVAAASFLNEYYNYFLLENGLRDKREEVEKRAVTDSYQAQKDSFKYMSEVLSKIADVHHSKATVYMFLSFAFWALTAVATVEAIWSLGCANIVQNEQQKNLMLKVSNFFKNQLLTSLNAEDDKNDPENKEYKDEKDKKDTDTKLFRQLLGQGIGVGIGATLAIVESLYRSPWTFVALCAASAVMNTILWRASQNAGDAAEEQRDLVDQIAAAFSDGLANKCDNRDDLANPKCYCYQEDGKKNPSRTHSDTCQNLWRESDRLKVAKASAKKGGKIEDRLMCVTKAGQPDEDCKCKMYQPSLCMSAPMMQPQAIGNIANATGMNSAVQQLNQMTNGFGKGNINVADTKKKATNAKRLMKEMQKQAADKLAKEGKKLPDLQTEGLIKSMASKITKEELAKFTGAQPGQNILANAPKNLDKKVLETIAKKTDLGAASYVGGGGMGKKAEKEAAPSFNFGSDSGGGSAGGKDLNFMDKSYDYKNSDIVKKEDVSIWQVISNRYNVTGLRKLFDDGTTNTPEQTPAPGAPGGK